MSEKYGHSQSVRVGRPVDAGGDPWPWYTYPAIEYLEQLALGDLRVFEFGCGNSTLYWGRRARLVHSVEDDRGWYEEMAARVPHNCRLVHALTKDDYVGAIERAGGRWDCIVVDGKWRPQCAERAIAFLAEGGFVVLDNSDWYPGAAATLRAHGLIEVDFSGFGPVNGYAWTTSLFFHRSFRLGPREDRQPRPCIGGIDHLSG